MGAIFRKEIKTYFTTFTGYAFLGFFVLMTGYFFISQNVLQGNGNYSDTIVTSFIMLLILIPVLTMRLFAEESRQKTDQLLFCSPIRISDIVLGKFLAAVGLFLLGLVITMAFPCILSFYGGDFSSSIGAIVGYFLMGACFISVGIFISVLTDNQIIAAAATFITLFVLLTIDNISASSPITRSSSLIFIAIIIVIIAAIVYSSTKNIWAAIVFAVLGFAVEGGLYFINPNIYDGTIVKALGWFSIFSRFENFYLGMFGISDVMYNITFAAVFLYLTVNVIEKRRWS